VLLGSIDGKIAATPLAEVVQRRKALDMGLIELAHVLAQ
jgi:hypothetical protein